MIPSSAPRLLALGVLSLLFLTRSLPAQPIGDGIVVLLSVDGLSHYYLDDPKAEMPTLRRLAKEGARARMMKASMPSVTWPNHTTLVTGVPPGKHGVIGNAYFDRTQSKVLQLIGDTNFDKDEIVKVPTIYDAAKAAGLRTAAVAWPATRGAKSLDWALPAVALSKQYQQYATATLWPEFKAAGLLPKKDDGEGPEQFKARDRMLTGMFNHIVHEHRPQLALFHVSGLDHIEHARGPQTPDAYDFCQFEDEQVRLVFEELEKSFPGHATMLVVSDHGFFPYAQHVQPNVLLRSEGLAGQVRSVAQGGSAFIYVLDAANRAALSDRVAALFQGREGIGVILHTPAEFAAYGLALPSADPHMPDLVISAKSGYAMSDSLGGNLFLSPKSEESKGTHGYDTNEPGMHATFIAWGAGIRPGTQLETIDNTAVAPTVAALLGIPFPSAEARPLEAILAR